MRIQNKKGVTSHYVYIGGAKVALNLQISRLNWKSFVIKIKKTWANTQTTQSILLKYGNTRYLILFIPSHNVSWYLFKGKILIPKWSRAFKISICRLLECHQLVKNMDPPHEFTFKFYSRQEEKEEWQEKNILHYTASLLYAFIALKS